MSSSWTWPEQETGSHSIWPCLWRHKWIITTLSNELDTIKGSLGHTISLWSGHCRGRSCQSMRMLCIFMLFYPRNCLQLMRCCRHGNICDVTSWCRTQRIYTSRINEVINAGMWLRGHRQIEGNWHCFLFTASWTDLQLLQMHPFIALARIYSRKRCLLVC